ncbi:HPF/RaiA family ribosome-associated protein [Aquimarina mytili]|uniref:HPF/RaiA family ribosome-associated protein n=1 Tax=Aquimarina mytili TaxID=874423 RepID=A0A937D8W9_9FLAO|nr:HPF/RaiA family ribosome-associated protein [Aquimarina mytili]MBL0684490.1 HPF/RaiA family ribosome-associated protein [Aquimarina mytili]
MKTVFEYRNVSSSNHLETFVTKRLEKLANKYSFVIRADVFFKKQEKDVEKGNICGIRLSLPGPRIYASSDEISFENAINNTICDLKDQLNKRKAKLYKNVTKRIAKLPHAIFLK